MSPAQLGLSARQGSLGVCTDQQPASGPQPPAQAANQVKPWQQGVWQGCLACDCRQHGSVKHYVGAQRLYGNYNVVGMQRPAAERNKAMYMTCSFMKPC